MGQQGWAWSRTPRMTDVLASELSGGRPLRFDLQFERGTPRLDPSSGSRVLRLARALSAVAGVYLVGAHADEGLDAAGNCALAAKRALEIKALLVLEGVPPERLIAAGYGVTGQDARARVPDRRSNARIDVMRVR